MQLDDDNLVSPLGGDLETYRAEVSALPEVPEKDPYEVLQEQYAAAQAERDAIKAERDAERARAEDLRGQVAQHQTNEVQNHKAIIEQAMVATQGAVDAAKERYRIARANGDIDEELTATELLQDARNELKQLKAGHEQVLEAAKKPPAAATQQGDPVEAYIDANFAEPRDREWLRLHKDDVFGADERRKQLAILGDQAATLRGLKNGTDAYYAFMDNHMGYEAPEVAEETDESETPPAIAAPVKAVASAGKSKRATGVPTARASGDGKAGSATSIPPEVAAIARDLGMSPAKYMEYQAGLAADKYPGYRLFR
jgi:hypothetical protein